MSEDNKSGVPDANLRGHADISTRFNAEVELGAQIAALSLEAKMQVEVFQKTMEQRQVDEQKAQQRTRGYRVLKQKTQLLENYIRDQANRPAEIRADPSADLKIIDERANEMVRAREEYYLKRIEQEATANIRQVIANDRQVGKSRDSDLEHDR